MPSLFVSRLLLPLILSSLAHAIFFPSDTQSCLKSSPLLLSRFGTESQAVDVKNCDVAINALCTSISTSHPPDGHDHNLVASYKSCQVHLIGFGTQDPDIQPQFNYEQCVQGFQSITIECLYIGVGKDAETGVQAGVRGVYMDDEGDTQAYPAVDHNIAAAGLAGPGFLVGPPAYFGDVAAEDVSPATGPGTGLPRRRARV